MANSPATTWAFLLLVAAALAAPQPAFSALPFGGNLFGCWRAVSSLEACAPKVVVPAAFTIQVNLSLDCCQAVGVVGEKCFPAIYPASLSYAPKLASFFQNICGGPSSPAPQPAASAPA